MIDENRSSHGYVSTPRSWMDAKVSREGRGRKCVRDHTVSIRVSCE